MSQIHIIENFLTEPECQGLIQLSEAKGYEEATVTTSKGFQMRKDIRDNSRVFYQDETLAATLWQKAVDLLPNELLHLGKYQAFGLNELFRFYKYEDNQRFNWHIDGAFIRNENEQSFYTFLIYLNEDFEGGQTDFKISNEVVAATGKVLIFNHDLRHKGCNVTKGTKYVLRTDIMYRLEAE